MLNKLVYINLLSLTLVSCKKFVTVDRVAGRYLISEVFSSDSLANAAIAGIYNEWKSYYNNIVSPGILLGLSADELITGPGMPEYNQYYTNEIRSDNSRLPWAKLYYIIYQANL